MIYPSHQESGAHVTTRGRKRKSGKREASGKLSRRKDDKQVRRSIDEQSAMQVAKEARQRVFGVSPQDSATELAGSVCGRLLLQGSINREQMDAAVAFQETYAAYQRAMDSPPPPRAVNIGGFSSGTPREISTEQSIKAKAHWKAACTALSRANEEHRSTALYAACQYVVLRDEFLPHLFGDLRLALNALSRHYGLLARAA